MRPVSTKVLRLGVAEIVLLLSSTPAAMTANPEGVESIVGQVRTDNGQVIPAGVTVRLDNPEGEAQQQPANSDGRFEFDNLPKVSYRLTATAEGFQPAEKDIDLRYGASPYIVTILLSPLNRTKQDPKALPALTDMQAPGSARKEYEKGARALAAKELDQARTHFEAAVALYPCYARAQTDLALTLTVLHQAPRAEAALKKALACDPGYLDAYPQLAQLYNAEKQYAASEALLAEGVRRAPDAWAIYYQLGVAYYGQAEYGKAEAAFLKARSLNSTPPPELHVKLADVYLKERTYDKAYAEMLAYLKADASGRFAAKVKKVMQLMKPTDALPAKAQDAKP